MDSATPWSQPRGTEEHETESQKQYGGQTMQEQERRSTEGPCPKESNGKRKTRKTPERGGGTDKINGETHGNTQGKL